MMDENRKATLIDFRAFIAALSPEACDMRTIFDEGAAGTDITEMQRLGWECGAAGCFYGWTVVWDALRQGLRGELEIACTSIYAVQAKLALDYHESQYLFYSYPDCSIASSWKEWMMKRLDIFIETGTIGEWWQEQILVDMAGETAQKRLAEQNRLPRNPYGVLSDYFEI